MMECVHAQDGYGLTATPDVVIFHGAPSVSIASRRGAAAPSTLKNPWGPSRACSDAVQPSRAMSAASTPLRAAWPA